jgi:hypothetical protein
MARFQKLEDAEKTYDAFCNMADEMDWNTKKIFKPIEEWHEDFGCALFFKVDGGEPPMVTSPISSNWVENYFTHWMAMPTAFTTDYRFTCILSGIDTKHR